MKIALTNFDCTECGMESPYGIMKIPFKCKCNHKRNWSTLPKNIFEGNEYPDSLKKFYSIFHQPERLNPENINLPVFECKRCKFSAKKYRVCNDGYIKCPECHEINICDSLNSMET